MSFSLRSLDQTIDVFFSQLTNFTKGIKEDVSSLQRTFENGYSLTPQELREQLKQLEKRIKDVRKEADDIEGSSFGELSLAELAHRSWTLYQETNNGISDLETHLRNYGYRPDKLFETVSYEHRSLSPPMPLKSSEASCPLTSSKSNWLNFDYSNNEEEVVSGEQVIIKNKTTPVSSKNQSTFSEAPFSFSRNLLTLKNKYKETGSENQVTPRSSGRGSFAFEVKTQEESMEVDEIAGTPCENLRESFATDFSIPFSHPPRLSFEVPAMSFGSPFRSPHKKPEYSVFFPSPVQRLISKRQYEELPDSVKMNLSFDQLNRELKVLKDSPEPLRFSEDDQNKVLLHGLELLGLLEKKMQDESVFFCPTEKWNQ